MKANTLAIVGVIAFTAVVWFLPTLGSTQQEAISGQQSTVTPATRVTLDGDFVQFDKTAKTLEVSMGGVTKHAIFQERYPIKKDHLESILASLKPGDKAQFIGYTKPDGTTVITTIVREVKIETNAPPVYAPTPPSRSSKPALPTTHKSR